MSTKRISINTFLLLKYRLERDERKKSERQRGYGCFASVLFQFCQWISKQSQPNCIISIGFVETKSSEKWKQHESEQEEEEQKKRTIQIVNCNISTHSASNRFEIDKRVTRTNAKQIEQITRSQLLLWRCRPKSVLNSHQNQSFNDPILDKTIVEKDCAAASNTMLSIGQRSMLLCVLSIQKR